MTTASLEDLTSKVLLALVSATFGACFKALADTHRVRALLPIVLEQLQRTTQLCESAFALADAQQADLLCESCFKAMCELVALGVRPQQRWRDGARLLLDTGVAIRAVTGRGSSATTSAFDHVRSHGTALRTWLQSVPPAR